MFAVHTQQQSKRWCFTVNNWNPVDETLISLLAPSAQYLVYGRELAPSTGTPHLQGYVVFHTNKRFAAVVALFPTGTHLEAARCSSIVCADYCKKDKDTDDIVEYGQVPGPVGKTNQYADFRDWVLAQPAKPSLAAVAMEFPAIFHNSSRVTSFIDLIYPTISSDPGTTRAYQQLLMESLGGPADPRKIIFVVDPVGNSGKTWFTEKLLHERPDAVQILSVGRREDLAFAVDERKSIFLFDLPRSQSEYLQFAILEQLKNRRVFSTKYQSRVKHLAVIPHVVVFTNEYPDMHKLSADRYELITWNNE